MPLLINKLNSRASNSLAESKLANSDSAKKVLQSLSSTYGVADIHISNWDGHKLELLIKINLTRVSGNVYFSSPDDTLLVRKTLSKIRSSLQPYKANVVKRPILRYDRRGGINTPLGYNSDSLQLIVLFDMPLADPNSL